MGWRWLPLTRFEVRRVVYWFAAHALSVSMSARRPASSSNSLRKSLRGGGALAPTVGRRVPGLLGRRAFDRVCGLSGIEKGRFGFARPKP